MSEQHSHIIPYRTFIIVWFALLVLTGITVAVAQVNLGALNVWVALGIATVNGYRSLGWDDGGVLAAGALADLVGVRLASPRTAGVGLRPTIQKRSAGQRARRRGSISVANQTTASTWGA